MPVGYVSFNAVAIGRERSEFFFITSNGPGQGADLGGLEGADAHCQQLAASAGVGGKTWRAYLSSSRENARDRIGMGPWHNIKGVMIASDLAGLHSEANGINKETGLTEQGEMVNGRGDSPNMHDILTGSNPDGTLNEGRPVVTGPAVAREVLLLDIMTASVCGMMHLPGPGTLPTAPGVADWKH